MCASNFTYTLFHLVLLQCGADAAIRNSDGKTALDLAEPTAKLVLSGDYKKEELLEAARTGNEELLMAFITPLNVNCHADDGRKVFLAAFIQIRGTLGISHLPAHASNLQSLGLCIYFGLYYVSLPSDIGLPCL